MNSARPRHKPGRGSRESGRCVVILNIRWFYGLLSIRRKAIPQQGCYILLRYSLSPANAIGSRVGHLRRDARNIILSGGGLWQGSAEKLLALLHRVPLAGARPQCVPSGKNCDDVGADCCPGSYCVPIGVHNSSPASPRICKASGPQSAWPPNSTARNVCRIGLRSARTFIRVSDGRRCLAPKWCL